MHTPIDHQVVHHDVDHHNYEADSIEYFLLPENFHHQRRTPHPHFDHATYFQYEPEPVHDEYQSRYGHEILTPNPEFAPYHDPYAYLRHRHLNS